MAIPTATTTGVYYIVEISMGSQFQGRSWDLDEYNRQMEYKHPKKTRLEIGAIRQQVNMTIAGTCMKFHKKIKFTNEAGKETLERECAEAQRKMQLIDTRLSCTPIFFEQTVTQLSTGNMFELMKKELNEQINQRVLSRMEKTVTDLKKDDGTYKPMTGKTRNALLKMIDGMNQINILDDPTVTARLETLKAQMQTASLIPMRDELLAYIEDIQNADTLEISGDMPELSPARAIIPEANPEAEREEEQMKARVFTEEDGLEI